MGFSDVYHGVNEMTKELCFELVRMSDEHMAEVREAKRMSDEHMTEVREANGGVDSMTDEELLEHGLVRMPKDADGVPIHVGDELCGYGRPNGGVFCKAVNERMVLVGEKDDGYKMWLLWDGSECHHYHAPTVEDVLREFTDEVWNRCCEGATASDSGIDELVAECAAKLQLRENK